MSGYGTPNPNKGKLLTEILILQSKGKSLREIAKEMHMAQETVRRWVKEVKGTKYCKRQDRSHSLNYDEGRDTALQFAGWNDQDIAYDLGMTEEELRKFRSDIRREREINVV